MLEKHSEREEKVNRPTFYCDVAITAIREFGMRSPEILMPHDECGSEGFAATGLGPA
jgi:hypothetical protein